MSGGVMTMKELSALLKFNEAGELIGVFPSAGSDEEMNILRDALERLIQPSFWQWATRFLP
jgi:hypothetical protein